MKQAYCPNHGAVSPAYQVGSPLGGAVALAVLGYNLSKGNAILTLLSGGFGLWMGYQAGTHCPQCGALLQFIEDIEPLLE